MKKITGWIWNLAYGYMNAHPKPVDVNLKANQITAIIQSAKEKNLALHAIYNDQSFTGDLVKYDKVNGKLILKNFQKNLSTIISVKDINRLSLVPPTVRKSQVQNIDIK